MCIQYSIWFVHHRGDCFICKVRSILTPQTCVMALNATASGLVLSSQKFVGEGCFKYPQGSLANSFLVQVSASGCTTGTSSTAVR